jgi:hypothetical protein
VPAGHAGGDSSATIHGRAWRCTAGFRAAIGTPAAAAARATSRGSSESASESLSVSDVQRSGACKSAARSAAEEGMRHSRPTRGVMEGTALCSWSLVWPRRIQRDSALLSSLPSEFLPPPPEATGCWGTFRSCMVPVRKVASRASLSRRAVRSASSQSSSCVLSCSMSAECLASRSKSLRASCTRPRVMEWPQAASVYVENMNASSGYWAHAAAV